MRDKTRFLIACFISIIPLCYFRVFLYKHILKYTIQHSKIGFGTIINIEGLNLINSSIGSFNLLTGPFNLIIDNNSNIGSLNIFRCGKWVLNKNYQNTFSSRKFYIGKNVVITNKHYFDISSQILINDDSWIAGYGSQFWTHGGSKKDNNITIAKSCYIGSAVRFSPGSEIASGSLVAMGSVVTKKFTAENIMIAGVPAKVIKENIDWRENWV